jgi:hypothetical protein
MLFLTPRIWPMCDQADPLTGWPIWEVHNTSSPATQDAYGKLFAYLKVVMRNFVDRLGTGRIVFELYSVDVEKLPQHLAGDRYARIEVTTYLLSLAD